MHNNNGQCLKTRAMSGGQLIGANIDSIGEC